MYEALIVHILLTSMLANTIGMYLIAHIPRDKGWTLFHKTCDVLFTVDSNVHVPRPKTF